jgi:hypothetical protein
MGAKESEEMRMARELVMIQGLTPYAAAVIAGITSSAIYMSYWYKTWKESKSK